MTLSSITNDFRHVDADGHASPSDVFGSWSAGGVMLDNSPLDVLEETPSSILRVAGTGGAGGMEIMPLSFGEVQGHLFTSLVRIVVGTLLPISV